MAFDYKKEYKALYQPPCTPHLITVPPMTFAAVRGQGDPNDPAGEYKAAIELLYGLLYTIKMSKKGSYRMEGYFDFVVPPLEGLWEQTSAGKESFRWTSLLRLPEFVTRKEFDWAAGEASAKKKQDFSKVEYLTYDEGLCVQCLHLGLYDDEPKTLARMETDGRLKAVITRELFSLPRRAGCQNVVELHGSIYENYCPRCGKAFDIGYMLETEGVPLCPECKVPIRPGVNLIGDRMSSARIAMAAAELAKADTLLILGGHMETPLVSNMLPYFHGNLVILVNESKHLSDRMADFTYYGKPRDILPQLYPAAADAISA